jgi:hypothetical protein
MDKMIIIIEITAIRIPSIIFLKDSTGCFNKLKIDQRIEPNVKITRTLLIKTFNGPIMRIAANTKGKKIHLYSFMIVPRFINYQNYQPPHLFLKFTDTL